MFNCVCVYVCTFTSAVGIWVWGRDYAFGTMLTQNTSGLLLVTVIEVGGGGGGGGERELRVFADIIVNKIKNRGNK